MRNDNYYSHSKNYKNTNYSSNYKNSQKKSYPDYSNDELVEDTQFIDPSTLKSYCQEDFENIKIVETTCPINSNLMLIDISLNPKGIDEELIYLQYPEYIKNIRRGNTLVEFYHYDNYKEKYVFEETVLARKGMMKFVDLSYQMVELKDNHYLRTDHFTEESKKNSRKIIMGPVLRSLSSGHSIEIFKLIKANGENAQISFLKSVNSWVIASKNVALLAVSRKDLESYPPTNRNGDGTRYSFAYIIGHCWFDYLDKINDFKDGKNILSDLKNYLSDKTFIGEYVGNQKHQHLIRYLKHTILFYAVVDNYSDDNSLPVEDAYVAFKKFKLDVVPYEKIGIFKDHKSICEALEKLYVRIAESSIIEEEEGSVVYLNEIAYQKNKNNSQLIPVKRTLVLCKLKTLEYRVYRKLREKLKNHLLASDSNYALDSRRKINQFFEEVRIMLQGYTLPMPMSFYYKVAETAFAFANKFFDSCQNLHSYYIDFLEVIHSIIDKTVDLKSRLIKGDNMMTYETLLKNVINSKKVIEIIIYAPPLYLPDEFLKSLEKKFNTEIRNSFIDEKEYVNLDFKKNTSNVVIYHINMHNFRIFNKLPENKFIFTFGLNDIGSKISMENLNEKIQIPQFISYNKNTSLSPFLDVNNSSTNGNSEVLKNLMNYFTENSQYFLENSKKYINEQIKSYEEFKNDENNINSYINDIQNVVDVIFNEKLKNLDENKIEQSEFLFNFDNTGPLSSNSTSKGIYDKNNNNKNSLDKTNPLYNPKIYYKNNPYIFLYEYHINTFTKLKETFLKSYETKFSLTGGNFSTSQTKIDLFDTDIKYLISKNSHLSNSTQNSKSIVILVPMTIPGTGKTFFVDQLKEILSSTHTKIAFDSISSDSIRRELINELKYTKGVNEEKAFNMSGKRAAIVFETELKNKFRKLVQNNTHSLLYLDKNHPPNAISRVFETLREEIKNISNVNINFVALLPDCIYPINFGKDKFISFSLSYFIQCYVRIRNRKSHPTLNGDNKNLLCILGMFINNFVNFGLNEGNLMLHYEFNKAIKLPFTEEIEEVKINEEVLKAGREFLNNMPSGNNIPAYDFRAEKFEKLINKFYPKVDNFKSTKNLVKETAGPILKKLFFGDGVDEIENLTKKSDTDNIIINSEKNVINLDDQKLKSLEKILTKNKNNDDLDTQNVNGGSVQNKNKLNSLFDSNPIIIEKKAEKTIIKTAKTQILEKNNINVVSKPKDFIYLGLLIENAKNIFYNDIILKSMTNFLKLEKGDTEILNFIKNFNNNTLPKNWNAPHQNDDNILHITTLYKGNKFIDDKILNHPAYKEFEEGKIVTLNVHGLVYVPGKTIFSIVSTKEATVDNEFPHITTLINGFAPKQSNDVMKCLFSKGEQLGNEYVKICSHNYKNGEDGFLEKVVIRINGFYLDCFVIGFKAPVIVESKMHAF